MTTKIERCEEVLVYSDQQNPWVRLYFDRVRWPNGRLGRYNRVVEVESNTGVAVLPIAGSLVGLVRQYRYPVDQEVWEIPRGFCDSDDAEANALRELHEETGLPAPRLKNLGPIHPNSGVLATTVFLFAALYDDAVPSSPTDPAEISEFRWVSSSKALTDATSGQIKDAFTLAALFRALRSGLLNG
jgi:ADP-ribose pyrophosphatase